MEVGAASQSHARPLVATESQIAGEQILWICPNLPRPEQDGGDSRRWQMIAALSRHRAAVSVWSETGHDAGRYGPALEAAGVAWRAPPPATRQEPVPRSTSSAIRDHVASQRWDAIVISYRYLAARHVESVRRTAPGVPLVIDLGNCRFHQRPQAEEREHANAEELQLYQTADALITASAADTGFLLASLPQIPGYTFAPLAPDPPARPQSTVDGPLVFWANMGHHANANAVGWWMDEIAREVTRRKGASLPLQLRGPGTEVYKSVWGASGRLEVGEVGATIDGARTVLLPLRHGSETAATALAAAVKGVPVVATSAALAGLDPAIRAHVSVGEDAGELAGLVVEMMTEDEAWHGRRDRLFIAAGTEAKRRPAREHEFTDWMARRRPIMAGTAPTQSNAS